MHACTKPTKRVTALLIPFLDVCFGRELGTMRWGVSFHWGNMLEPPSVHTILLESIYNEQNSSYRHHQAGPRPGPVREVFMFSSSCLSPILTGKEAAVGGRRGEE